MRALSSRSVKPCILTLGAVLLVTGLVLSAGDEKAPVKRIEDLAFLAGSWSGEMWGGVFEAYYSTPAGGKVLSFSELKKDGKVSFHEFERFDMQAGVLTFTPYPGGKRATQLVIATLAKNRAVFENPKKDFPTRIDYHRSAPDQLVITLTDPHGGSDQKQVFELKRTK